MTPAAEEWLISVDDHLIEPPAVRRSRLPTDRRKILLGDAERVFDFRPIGRKLIPSGPRAAA